MFPENPDIHVPWAHGSSGPQPIVVPHSSPGSLSQWYQVIKTKPHLVRLDPIPLRLARFTRWSVSFMSTVNGISLRDWMLAGSHHPRVVPICSGWKTQLRALTDRSAWSRDYIRLSRHPCPTYLLDPFGGRAGPTSPGLPIRNNGQSELSTWSLRVRATSS